MIGKLKEKNSFQKHRFWFQNFTFGVISYFKIDENHNRDNGEKNIKIVCLNYRNNL